MIRFSNGVELSEKSVIEGLKKAGIEVKSQFKAGDIADYYGELRIIVRETDGTLRSFSERGIPCNAGQEEFKRCGYKKVCIIEDLFKGWKNYRDIYLERFIP